MSPSPKAAKFDLFSKGVNREALQETMGYLGTLPQAQATEAENFILYAAWNCLRATEEENEAPTRPAFAEKLQDTRKTAHKFFRQLNSIFRYFHPIASWHNLLNVASDEIKREALFYNFIEIQSRLALLIDTLTAVERELKKQGLDKGAGGSLNWCEFLNGTAKWQLAWECHGIFEGYRPGKAKSTKGGVFDHFCAAVYGIALDVNPTSEGIGIHRYTEHVCRISKKFAPRQARHNEIRRALRNLDLPESTRRNLIKEQEKIIRQLQAIESPYPW